MTARKRNQSKTQDNSTANKKGKTSAATSPSASPKVASKPALPVSKHKYWIFTIDNGNHQYFATKEAADKWLIDFECIVTERKSFTTKKSWEAHKRMLEKQKNGSAKTPPTGSNPDNQKMSPEEIASVEKVKRRLDLMQPKNRLEVYWKTSSYTTLVVVIFRFLTTLGKDFWTLKPDHLETCMKNYVVDFPVDTPQVQYALLHLATARKRDNNAGPNDVSHTSKKLNGVEKRYDDKVLYTTFLLPDNIESRDEETAFIENMCRKIGENLKAIQATPTYQSSLQHLVSEKFWTMMTAPNSGPSFLQYIRDIQIKVQQLSNMNTHVVLDDVKDLTSQMLLHRTPTEKFQNETPNDNDDDNSGNDDNVTKGNDEEQEDDEDEHEDNDEEDRNDEDGNNNDQDNQDENNSGDDQDADGTKN
jgi:hypothetical protein